MTDRTDKLRAALMLASSEHGAHDVVTVDQALAVCDAYFEAMPSSAITDEPEPASTAVDIVAARLRGVFHGSELDIVGGVAYSIVVALHRAGFIPDVVDDEPSTAVDVRVQEAVRTVHQSRTMTDGYGMPSPYCVECRQVWPCATIVAIGRACVADTDDGGEEPF